MFAPRSVSPATRSMRPHPAPTRAPDAAARQGVANQSLLLCLAARRESAAVLIDRPDGRLEQQATQFASQPGSRPTAGVAEPSSHVAPPAVQDVLRQPGTPLDSPTRDSFEPHLGRSLTDVRPHIGTEAAAAAASVDARAFAVGPAIVFGAGQYKPGAQATTYLLAHELAHTVQQDQQPLRLSRQPAGSPVPAVPADAPDPQEHYLDDASRADIIGDTRLRIGLAFTAFGNACTAYRDAIKNEAKARAEMFSTVIDIATGFLAPAFATVGTALLAARAATKVSGPAAKVAGAAAANATTVRSLISQSDKFKATFTGASKVATLAIKSNAMALFGETDIDAFASKLRDAFQAGAAALSTSLSTLDDNQMITLWAGFDDAAANETAYRAALKGVFERFRCAIL
jgi:hypothetical protein